MLNSSIWCKLLLLGDDESLMHRDLPRGNVNDAVRWPTFLQSLATAAPLADLFLLQAGTGGIYPAAPF